MTERAVTLLVLDDDPEDVELIEDLLDDVGADDIELHAAHTVDEALSYLEGRPVDVCLVDYRLGAESGVDFIRDHRVRRFRVPMILMTGMGTPEVDRAALEAGAVDYLPKGEMDGPRLTRSLRYAIERRRRQRLESRMNALLGSTRELVFIIDAEGVVQYASPSLEHVLESDPTEWIGSGLLEEIHPDDRAGLEDGIRRAIESPSEPASVECRIRHPARTWRWIDATVESHLDDPDIDGVVISAWDVTDRVRAEEDVRFHAELLEAAGQAVIATDLEGRVLYWNPAAERLYGWTRDEAVGRPVEELTVLEEARDDAAEIMAKLRRGETWQGEFQVRRKDGSTFTALVANSPLLDGEGRLTGIIGASSDITAVKRTEEELRERVKELGTLNQASALVNRTDLSMDERLRGIVESLPEGWLHPERTEARLTLPGRVIETGGFRETPWMQAVDVSTDDEDAVLEVAFTGDPPAGGESPFLDEERELLESVGSLIRQARERSSLNTLLTEALASLQEAVFVVGSGRTIRYANPGAQEIFGYSVAELIGETTEKLHVGAGSFRSFGEESKPPLVRDGVFFGSYEMRRKDGRIFPAEQTVTLLDPDLGLEGGVVSVVRDVSAQRAAERELRESERRFREIAEVIDDVFWVTTPGKEGLEYLSPAYETIWGRPVEAVYEDPSSWMDAVVPADRPRVRRFVQRQAEGPQTEEYRIRRPDGEERQLLDRSFPVHGADGSLEKIIGVARDVTEERRLEERFGILSREISDVIYVLSADGVVLTTSPSVEAATGYTPEEFEGSNALAMVHPDDRDQVTRILAEVAEEPGRSATAEYRIVDKSGGVHHVESVARNLLDTAAVGGILVTSRDVTERHELERRVRQMQKMESVGRLAGGVAHDFNNILTVIRSQADLILMEKPEEGITEDVTVIQDAADRAARLTKQLLAFSREQVMQPKNVDLGDSVRNTADLLQRLIGEQVRVRYEVDADLPPVRVDPNHVEQVLINLSVNARDAMPGGGELLITVTERQVSEEAAESIPDLDAGHYVTICVTDTGVGMEEDVLHRIFEPFFTTKAKGEGTGLGLSMVYGTIRQSGGSIQVESTPGEGSTFHLYFPVVEGAVVRSDWPGARPGAGREEGSGTVLVVEDDGQVRNAARRVLESAGFRVVDVESAEAALERLGSGEMPDVVLTDLILGGMEGYELMEEVADRWPDLPVVVMSGYAQGSPGRKGLPADVPFVQKPFTPANLVTTVRDALSGTSGRA